MALQIPDNPPYELGMDPPGYIADKPNLEVEAVAEKHKTVVAHAHNNGRLFVSLDRVDLEGE